MCSVTLHVFLEPVYLEIVCWGDSMRLTGPGAPGASGLSLPSGENRTRPSHVSDEHCFKGAIFPASAKFPGNPVYLLLS